MVFSTQSYHRYNLSQRSRVWPHTSKGNIYRLGLDQNKDFMHQNYLGPKFIINSCKRSMMGSAYLLSDKTEFRMGSYNSNFGLMKKGDCFESFHDFNTLLENLQASYGLTYKTKKSKKIVSDKNCNKKWFNPALVYSQLWYQCDRTTSGHGAKVQCPSSIRLYSVANSQLRIKEFDMKHNHEVKLGGGGSSQDTVDKYQRVQILTSRLSAMLLSTPPQDFETHITELTKLIGTGTVKEKSEILSDVDEETNPLDHLKLVLEEDEGQSEENIAAAATSQMEMYENSVENDCTVDSGEEIDEAHGSISEESVPRVGMIAPEEEDRLDANGGAGTEVKQVETTCDPARYSLRKPKAGAKPNQSQIKKKTLKVAFKLLKPYHQIEQILRWLNIAERIITRICMKEYVLKPDDFESKEISYSLKALDRAMPDWLDLIIGVVSSAAYDKIAAAVKELPEHQSCPVCSDTKGDDEKRGAKKRLIQCMACFIWYHPKCCGIFRIPKEKTWFCDKC
ncbi:hypothetical protein QAD02_010302 [Eretmocerus hayati]|uniref:Uncharacterized protein n=1 Tax=Eretmocerus hayati TaxID=131215 RepID=A0ACC2NC70_9HYME|nr:hypothetical protein QAD02_010302 [Eretmocerus hayati]